MQRLIDAERYKKEIFRIFPCNDKDDKNIRKATEIGINSAPTVLEIPEQPTNGDMIKALFMSPHTYIKRSESKNLVVFDTLKFPYEWWNAPYKGNT